MGEALPEGADGGDSPAWSYHRPAYEAPAEIVRRANKTPYAELHCHSSFSFLDGASQPEELVEEAVRAGLEALALTDHDGFYGVVRFAEAARAVGLPTVFGAELSLGLHKPQNGVSDPEGDHLVVLARDPDGYAKLATAISAGQMGGREKGKPDYSAVDWSTLHQDHLLVLTGCRKGPVPRALLHQGPTAARRELDRLIEWFGRDNVAVELWDHGDPLDSVRNDALAELAVKAGVGLVATNNVHYAVPSHQRLATALAAVRARRSLDDMAGWLPASTAAHVRSGDEQARRFRRWDGVVERAAELGRDCAFDLSLVAPQLPPFPCPAGLDEMEYLRRLVLAGAVHRYGTRDAERVPGAWAQIDHELKVIETLGFPGYFLVVWEIVEFCRQNDIFCQGRGSAANSAVCYVLGITNADAVSLELLFERFLSTERDGPPDIDIDIESDRREEVIQHVYKMHGRWHAAQVANVISYRSRSAVRDMAKALGYSPGQQDAWSRQIDPWGPVPKTDGGKDHDVPLSVVQLAREVEHLPRHLGIHSGGMVICDRPIVEVCPVEWARMENRSVLQWDKDDCAAVGLVKFDLLGLGMLSALHYCVDLVEQAQGTKVDLAELEQDKEVYAMLCRADSVGVFQVESRAQMATLPRLRPEKFYDLVVEVALIRPGPIQGGSVHPYIRRRKELEEPTCLHPLMEPALRKTLGVPLFQEQLMQIAMDMAGFTPAEADELRQAMGSKRSRERMEKLRQRLYDGMSQKGVVGEVAERIWDKLVAFASYGFPESHSVSFAYLVYASSWLKRYYPAAFCAGLLNAQPMGFYSPHSLVQDARRHGVEVRTPSLNASGTKAILEDGSSTEPAPKGAPPHTWGQGGPVVRLGLSSVREIGDELAERLMAERDEGGPYTEVGDLVRRVTGMTGRQLEALATAGAMECLGLERREALWVAGALAGTGVDRLDGVVCGAEAPPLPGMEPAEEARADLWATGVSPEGHPTRFVRELLDELGVVPASRLHEVDNGARVTVGGVVTHRQRPATAGGTMFVNLEDEFGLINVVVSKGCWTHYRRVVLNAAALLVRGRLERAEGVTNILAQQMEPLPIVAPSRSRDFR
ncbi:MAG TPA: error-prone DNA polymerase [Acidimicrobiales bacterium]